MKTLLDGLARFWAAFMEYNRAFDGTLFIILIFLTLWKMLGMLGSEGISQEALTVLDKLTTVFQHILSGIAGALFMKAAMEHNGHNGGKPNA